MIVVRIMEKVVSDAREGLVGKNEKRLKAMVGPTRQQAT